MTQQQQNMARMDNIDQFQYITIHTWLRRLGNKAKETYYPLLSLTDFSGAKIANVIGKIKHGRQVLFLFLSIV